MDKWPAYAKLSTVAPAGHLPTASQHPQTPSRGALSSPRGVAIAREMGGAVASDLTAGPALGLLAQVLVAKFCDHTPLHRQAGIYAREGVELDRSTLADWVGRSVFLLDPLAEAIGRHVRAGQVLHADDTTVPGRRAPGTGKTRTGRACGWSCGTTFVGIGHSAGRLLSLLAGPQGHPRPGAARPLPRLPSCRWLCRLRQSLSAHHAGRRAAADRGGVLESRTPEILLHPPRLGLADRAGSNGAHRRPVCHRDQRSRTGPIDAWPRASNTPGRDWTS